MTYWPHIRKRRLSKKMKAIIQFYGNAQQERPASAKKMLAIIQTYPHA